MLPRQPASEGELHGRQHVRDQPALLVERRLEALHGGEQLPVGGARPGGEVDGRHVPREVDKGTAAVG